MKLIVNGESIADVNPESATWWVEEIKKVFPTLHYYVSHYANALLIQSDDEGVDYSKIIKDRFFFARRHDESWSDYAKSLNAATTNDEIQF